MLANYAKMANDSGGLAKVACAFSSELARRGHDIELVYSDENTGAFFYPIEKRVRLVNLNAAPDGSVIRFPLHLKAARELLRSFDKRRARAVNDHFQTKYLIGNVKKSLDAFKPEVIVSFQPASARLLLSDLHVKAPVIVMSHGDPEDYFQTYPTAELPALEACAMNQVLMPSFERAITRHLPKAKTITIGNAIRQIPFQADLAAEKPAYKIVTVGKLTQNHKRPHLLIEAFAKVAAKHPAWTLELWGAKDKEIYFKKLEALIESSGLKGRVFLKGSTTDVPGVLKSTDLFAFPSAYEGFGMALAEGMSAGLPAVAYRSCPAVNELIEDGKTGILCDDGVEPFARALDTLMGDRELRIRMGAAAKTAMAEFAPERIWDKWERLIEAVAREKSAQ